jgi:hypothetical protein
MERILDAIVAVLRVSNGNPSRGDARHAAR